jgi:TPP-dependent 2-oxoacid decarboxylase
MSQSAAHRLIETLVVNGVTHVFCVPGESYLAVLDALVDFKDRIQVITCRHEAAAANMAVAYAWTRSDAREHRHSHGVAGLGACDHVRRASRAK